MGGIRTQRSPATDSHSDSSDSEVDPFDKLVSQLEVNPKYQPILKRRRLEETGAEQSEDDDDDGDGSELEENVELTEKELEELRAQYGDNIEIAPQSSDDASDNDTDEGDHSENDENTDSDEEADTDDNGIEDPDNSESGEESEVNEEEEDDAGSVDSDGNARSIKIDYGFYDRHFHSSDIAGQPTSDFVELADGLAEWKATGRFDKAERQTSFASHPTSLELLNQWPGNQLQSASTIEPSPLSPIISRYQDLVFTCRAHGNDQPISDAYLSHIVRHILYGRRKVAEGDEILASDPDAEVRDQGFTQPKVLIMCPFKSNAFDVINRLLELLPHKYTRQISNRKRFVEEFGPPNLDDDELNRFNAKPELYRAVIQGNFDDNFRIGIKLGNRSVKLYSEFYSSDIIIASPLGLRMIVGGEGDKPSEREFDFLSSLEILVLDQSDVYTMQNWDHVVSVLDCCNQIPRDGSHTDFSRVHHWHLDGLSSRYRQTLVFASHCLPEINSLANKYCRSVSGTIKIRQKRFEGVLEKIVRPIRQHFQRFDPGRSVAEASEARFKWFSSVILPQLKEDLSAQILIFIPSYFDYVRVRNLLRSQKVKVALCSEYTGKGSVARARSRFFHGQQKFLICTERFHFFRRYCIRGAHTVFFYSIPQEPEFYVDFLNAIEADTQQTSLALFSRFDSFALERIIGSVRAAKLIGADKDLHMFC